MQRGDRVHAPAAVVGSIVHEVIRQWLPPQEQFLESVLETVALQEGLVEPGQRKQAITESRRLLSRLWGDPQWQEMDNALERYHEVPFTRTLSRGKLDLGTIDLIYRDGEGWNIVDFKTDELRDETDLNKAKNKYQPQLMRYILAVRELLGDVVQAQLCFLDYQGAVEWVLIP